MKEQCDYIASFDWAGWHDQFLRVYGGGCCPAVTCIRVDMILEVYAI